MAAKALKNNDPIEATVSVDGKETTFTFKVQREHYNDLMNGMSTPDKISAYHNFLMQSVIETEKHALDEFIDATPQSEIMLGDYVAGEYTPDIKVMVKKPNK